MAERELIVEFHPGVSEDEARQVARSAGATVRRRMQSDPDRILLLLKLDGATGEADRKLAADSKVARVESNDPNYRAT